MTEQLQPYDKEYWDNVLICWGCGHKVAVHKPHCEFCDCNIEEVG
jgi:hypothetical protein